jgi:hypothetical protein
LAITAQTIKESQHMRRPHLLIAVAWLLHTAAWFLPVINFENFFRIPGWWAFLIALLALWSEGSFHFDAFSLLKTVSALTTILFIVGSPWVVLRGSTPLRYVSAWASAIAFLFNAHWFVTLGPDRKYIRIGYFLWWFSFAILTLALFDIAKSYKTGRKPDSIAEPSSMS